MMKRFLFVLLLVTSFCEAGFSQFVLDDKRYVDSLKRVLDAKISDSDKAYACFTLSNYYFSASDTALSGRYLTLMSLYDKNKSPFLQALYYYQQASTVSDNEVSNARLLCIKADSILRQCQGKIALTYRAKIWSLYSYIEQKKDNHLYDLSILFDKCIPLAKASGDRGYMGLFFSFIGLDFTNHLEYAKADAYYEQGITMCHDNSNQSYVLYIYLKAAENNLYRDSLRQANQFLDSSEVILRPYPQSHFYIAYYYDKAVYYATIKRFSESIPYIENGMALAKQFRQDYQVQRLLFLEQQAYAGEGNYAAARDILLYLINYQQIHQIQNDLYYDSYIADVYAHLKDYKQAYLWQSRYSSLLDSAGKSGVNDNMNSLEVKFRTSEKEKQIMQLAGEKRQSELAAKNNRLYAWLLGSGCLLLFVGIIFAFLLYRNNRKISAQKIKAVEQHQQLHIAQAMLDGEERERMRVAQDLHDGLGGMLAGVKINLSGWMDSYVGEDTQDKTLSKVIDQLDNSVGELRKIARNMMPATLMKYGLESALGELCDFYISGKCRINLQTLDLKSDIPVPVRIHIYRIIQELLSNAVKHAGATNIIVQCSQNEALFLITVEDNGKGFDVAAMDTFKGLGLQNLKNRVGFLKGKIDFYSSEKDGTTVNVELNVYEA